MCILLGSRRKFQLRGDLRFLLRGGARGGSAGGVQRRFRRVSRVSGACGRFRRCRCFTSRCLRRGIFQSLLKSEVNIELNFPPKLRGARSRLYRRRFLQVNTRWKARAEIYTMHSFAPCFNLKISAKKPQHFFAIEKLNFRFFQFLRRILHFF